MGRPLSDDWRDWLRLNRDRGCDRAELFRRAEAEGFDPTAVALELGRMDLLVSQPQPAAVPPQPLPEASDSEDFWVAMASPPLADPVHRPRAWRLDTDRAQIYDIPDLLTPSECEMVIRAIDAALVPSTVTHGPSDYRTSRTCHLHAADAGLASELDQRFARLLGVPPALSEPIQGQRYDVGQYFKAHTDWFAPGTAEYAEHASLGGQRTWTLMVYLNAVPAGGETVFQRIGRRFIPIPGLALAWNNLHANGEPNHDTLHEAMPILEGRKYVITKWFRARPGRCG
jgi:prolyl 4-hydroxylase